MNLIRFIADFENIDIDKFSVPKRDFVAKLENVFEMLPDFFRRALIHKRMAKITKSKDDREKWLLINAIYLLLFDLNLEQLKNIMNIVHSVHNLNRASLNICFDETDKRCIDQYKG